MTATSIKMMPTTPMPAAAKFVGCCRLPAAEQEQS